ncbi:MULTISPECIES: helix-turn-helix transcriptional regulator [unclassified Breznakia]|uniref:helix-turn-helix transcriptional regulator n=1 Tax=unclassified Breznakia TaxID=2623764 RepID=UPI002406113C|nr:MULTISPECIES: helix-turn-helix transcriptional regulator [unclassified Breznakia]MDF9837342.1 AraC family transcriptional regulator [Breznakia sp. PFB2-8]MDF9859277.1 AraC family transcriptional regulator [Breznakia sp. PH5-24]
MYTWKKQIQIIVDEIDECIKQYNNEALTLRLLSDKLGYSEFYMTRKFKEISGMKFREYVIHRKLAFALKEVRDSDKSISEIAFTYGFSSHEAFTRSFKKAYGVSPSNYRKNPKPLVLRTKINTVDRYFLGSEELGMINSIEDIKIYYVTIPAHKFVYIKNCESNGYWDFWEKQNCIAGQDYETICGLLDSMKGKLDDYGSSEVNGGSGQVMAYINDLNGRLCDWGFLRSECYGARLPKDYKGYIPKQMDLLEIPEAEYLVFEHGPFNYEQESVYIEKRVEKIMATFDFTNTEYCFDMSAGRIMYFYYDPERFWKYVRPVKRKK